MSPRYVRSAFFIAMAMIILSRLFYILHWEGGMVMNLIGWGTMAVYFLLVLIEIAGSKKADQSTKLLWGAAFLIAPVALYCSGLSWRWLLIVVLANVYLGLVRKQFLYTRQEVEESTFDIFRDDPQDKN